MLSVTRRVSLEGVRRLVCVVKSPPHYKMSTTMGEHLFDLVKKGFTNVSIRLLLSRFKN